MLIIRLSSLGDILLTTPLIRSLHELGYSPDLLLRPQYLDTVKYNAHLDKVLFFSETDESLFNTLSSRNYSAVIDLQNNMRSNRLTKKLGVPVFKFQKHSLRKFLLVHFKINMLRNVPASIPERYAGSIKGIHPFENFQLDSNGLDLSVPSGITPQLNEPGKYIGLCPGSRHFTKQWPEEYYVELGNILIKNSFTPILFGGKSDRDICKRISSGIKGSVDLSNDDRLLQTAAEMKRCAAVVCNDSGLMHTACAVHTPVIAIFGSTVREFGFIPYNNHSIIIEKEGLKCRPCSHIGKEKCPLRHFNCMKKIMPETVFANILQLTDKPV